MLQPSGNSDDTRDKGMISKESNCPTICHHHTWKGSHSCFVIIAKSLGPGSKERQWGLQGTTQDEGGEDEWWAGQSMLYCCIDGSITAIYYDSRVEALLCNNNEPDLCWPRYRAAELCLFSVVS